MEINLITFPNLPCAVGKQEFYLKVKITCGTHKSCFEELYCLT